MQYSMHSINHGQVNPALCGAKVIWQRAVLSNSIGVNDILGGDILKTKLDEGWHYYNRINGGIIDFTKSQFTKEN